MFVVYYTISVTRKRVGTSHSLYLLEVYEYRESKVDFRETP